MKEIFAALAKTRLAFNSIAPEVGIYIEDEDERYKQLTDRVGELANRSNKLSDTAESLYPFVPENIYAVPLALQEYSIVMSRAAARVAARLTSLDSSKTADMVKTIREKLTGPLAPLMANLFDLIERVRYAGPDQKIPHLPIGTAQIIDTVELFMLRVVQEDLANSDAGSILD